MVKNVVVIGPAYPLRGGIAAFVERIASAYIDQGSTVQIETFKYQYPSILFPGKTQYSVGEKPSGLKINTSINSINPFNWIRVGNRIRKQNPDLVVFKFWIPFMSPCLGTIGRIIRRNKRTKVICVVDNIVPHERRSMDKLLASYFVKSMDGFIAMSKTVLNQLNSFDLKIPKLVSPHPVYDHFGLKMKRLDALGKLRLDPNDKYLLFFGIVRDYKGLDILLEAMSKPKVKEIQGLKLLIAGEFYSSPEIYLNLIEKYELKDRVILKNEFIPDTDVGAYFCAADIIVQPYKSATQSGVTQIAYHFEKPMIVTNVGGLPEIVPHHKVGYVTNVCAEEVADAIYDFYSSNRKDSFESNLKEEKKKYSWEYMLNSIDRLIQDINSI